MDSINIGNTEFDPEAQVIKLWGSNISDLSPLSACLDLVKLDLSDNPVRNLEVLAAHKDLSWLNLSSYCTQTWGQGTATRAERIPRRENPGYSRARR